MPPSHAKTKGETGGDFMSMTMNVGYAISSLILIGFFIAALLAQLYSKKFHPVLSFRVELLYWITILFSNTLGTAFGDFLADDSGLGFVGGAALISGLLLILVLLYFFTNISRVILFWVAFVLTRPLGATFGDLLTKSTERGGFNPGTIASSIVLAAILVIFIVYQQIKEHRGGTPPQQSYST